MKTKGRNFQREKKKVHLQLIVFQEMHNVRDAIPGRQLTASEK